MKTLHLPNKPQQRSAGAQQQPRPAPAPVAKAWKNLTGKNVVIRLKSGVSVSGAVTEVALGVMTLTGETRILEREALDWLVPKGAVHVDAASISFVIEGARNE